MSLKQVLNSWQVAPLNKRRVQPKNRKLPDEESFFNAFIDYFNGQLYSKVYARKTHGYRIKFVPSLFYQQLWNFSTVKKEISDVFVIAFSLQKHMIRMTHLQAKYLREAHISTKPFTFELDTGQFYMLSNRLEILDNKGLYPPTILSHPLLSDSIASYGVFYSDANGDMDMAFELASLIKPIDLEPYPAATCSKEHVFATTTDLLGYLNHKGVQPCWSCPVTQQCPTCPQPHACCNSYCYELLSTLSIDKFEQELYDMHVGTRVDLYLPIIRWLSGIFNGANDDVYHRFEQCVAEIEEIHNANNQGRSDRNNHNDNLIIFGLI